MLRVKISKFLWVLLALIWIFIAFNWLIAGKCEPIHEKIVGQKWEEMNSGTKDVIIFFMRVTSGMCLGIGVCILFMVFGPLKHVWCCTDVYLFLLNLLSLAPLTWVNIRYRYLSNIPNIEKEPNWILCVISLLICVFAFLLGKLPCKETNCAVPMKNAKKDCEKIKKQ